MTTGNKRLKHEGFTLVEVMVACVLLAMVLCAYLGTFGMAQRAANSSNNTMSGLHQCRSVLEQVMSYGYYDSRLSIGTHTVSNGSYVVSTNSSFSETKDIFVTLRWIDPGTTRTTSVDMVTSITRALH